MATFFFWVNLSLFFSKKKRVGFMYTFFAITLVASLAFLVAVQSNNLETSKLAEKIKSDEVFYFMRGVDADPIRAGEISGRRALLAMADIEITKGYFLLQPNESIKQAMLNGTFNNTLQFVMENSTLNDWETSMDILGSQRDINSNINITSVVIGEGSAFAINATINASMKTSDPVLEIRVNKNASLKSQISIEDIEDSFNTVYSNNEIQQIIQECSYLTGNQKNNNSTTNWAAGKAVKSILGNLSLIANAAGTIAIVPDIDLVIDDGSVEGIVSEAPRDLQLPVEVNSPYVANLTNAQTLIQTNELITIDDFKVYQTNVTTDQTKSTCYFHNPNAPSFLTRLKGDYDATDGTYGISSFIYVADKEIEQDNGAKYYPFPLDYNYWDRLGLSAPAY